MSRPPGLKTYILASIAVPIFAGSQTAAQPTPPPAAPPAQTRHGATGHRMQRGRPFQGDVRDLPQTRPHKGERPEREEPEPNPSEIPITGENAAAPGTAAPSISPTANAPAPSPKFTFDGLDFATWGTGHPPDTNGDAGPVYYVEAVNTAVGVYRKSDGTRVAAFTFNALMSQGAFGNLCDTDNQGDPVVLYDTFEDRWVISDFAFKFDASGNVVNPPGAFECFAVSRSGDPVSGGWYFYSISVAGGLGDYPKLGVWSDAIYLSVNLFPYAAGGAFIGPRLYALNKAQMYAGDTSVQVQSIDVPTANPSQDFTLLPSNARLQTGTPPPGTPNFFVSTWRFTNALSVYKFHVDWNDISLSTLTGPSTPTTSTSWPCCTNPQVPNAPSLNGNALDVLATRAMMQNQYTNLSGVESLWTTHTVRRQDTSGFAAPRWYQVNVTGGAVATPLVQASTWDPDGANVTYRYLPSLAVDRAGNMALGYSSSNSSTKPAMMYAGRLATDPLGTFSQTEQVLYQGTGTQVGNCGGSSCTRWGDYSSMTLDPDGCTFWYANEYYATDGLNDLTRIGAFSFPGCTARTNAGTLQGTVTSSASATPIAGAAVALGSRVTYTDANGFYAFRGLPSGTYPTVSAGAAGFVAASVASQAVADTGVTTRDFALDNAAGPGCQTDTSQADFQAGIPVSCDLTSSSGNVILNAAIDQQQIANNSSSGNIFSTAVWFGQTFVPSVTGWLTRLDVDIFCSGCTGTTPDITVEIRTTSGGLPTSTVLASTTIAGFPTGAAAFHTATFSAPAMLTAGTQYAYSLRLLTNPSAGNYAAVFSNSSAAYSSGNRVAFSGSPGSWSIILTSGTARDLSFKAFMFPAAGTFTSSVKDANPAAGFAPVWSMLSWNPAPGAQPAGASVSFQGAASNNPAGPFSFVGPDGTAATFFNSGASLAQFNGYRYFRYQAQLSTSTSSAAPSVSDVTTCFDRSATTPTVLAVGQANGVYGGTVNLSATLTSGGSGVAGKTIAFKLDGELAGTAATDANGSASLPVTIAGIDAGTYPARVAASFAGDTTYPPASLANALVVAKADQVISFDPIADRVATDPPFTVTVSGGGSGNPVTLTSTTIGVCTVSGTTVTLIMAGTCTIDADQAGSNNYNAAPTVTQSFNVTKASQSITFAPVSGFVWSGGSAALSATADSGLAVVFSVLSGPCTVSGTTLTASGAGTCVVAADQPGDGRYAAATEQTQTVSIAKASQTISFGALANHVATDAPFTIGATGGGSTSAVVFSTTSTGVCSVSGNVVTLVAAGTCSISADQAGDANYLAAPTVTQSFNVTKATQTITFPAVAAFVWKTQTATLAASADSGLAIVYGTASPCSISGTTLSASAAGSCDVTADQPGNGKYAAAAQVKITVTVSKAPQTISFAAPADHVATDAPFTVSATGGASGNPVTFSTASSGICGVSGATVTLLGSGTCSISADQAGDANYDPAPQVTRSFNVSKAPQTISFPAIASFVWNGGSSALAATATSGLAVTYSVVSGNCAISGTSVTATHAGSCIVAADQPGDARYAAATQVTTTVSVSKAAQAIAFGTIADHKSTDPAFTVSATGGGSGNPVTFSTASSACSVSGSQVTPLVIGVCTVLADQAGNGDYDPAPEVSQSFNVLATPQAITFPAIAPFGWSGGSATLTATADSGLPVGFSVLSGPCQIAAGTLTATHAGSCVIAADQGGDNRYAAAAEVTQTVTVLKAPQAISFAPLPDKVATDPGFTVTASGGASGSPVTFSTPTPAVCSVSGNTVTLLAGGTCSISADQTGNADYNDAAQVTQSFQVAFASQSIDFPAVASFNWSGGSATLAASATSGLAVTYRALSGPCSVSGNTVTASAAGSCTIAADQAGDARYAPAPQARQTVVATKTPQSIAFPAISPFVWNLGSTTLAASATSGLPIAYSVASGPCAVAGTTVTATAAGVCTIAADQPGNAVYAAAAQVTAMVSVGKTTQSISFGALPSRVATDPPFTVSATGGGSALPVTFSTASTACTVSGNVVTLLAAGTCAIAADQAGDANYDPAPQVVQSFSIAFASQAITFPPVPGFVWKTGSTTVAASASSGLPIAYAVVSGPCAISGTTVTSNHAGNCVIAADQAGDARYAAAAQVTTTVVVRGAPQAIRFAPMPGKLATDAPFAAPATGDASGNPVTLSTSSAACSVSGAMVILNSAGTCSISANQAGNADYDPAPTVTQDLSVSLTPQTITFAQIAPYSRRDEPEISLVATSSSGLPVVFSLISGPCRVAGTTLTSIARGTCTVGADQPGDTRYGPAHVEQTVTITDAVTASVGGCASTSPGALALFGLAAIGLLRRRRS